jgi:hypothetical protein
MNKRKENEENKKSSRWADFVAIVVYQAKGFLLLLSNLLICQVTLKTVSQSRSLFRDRRDCHWQSLVPCPLWHGRPDPNHATKLAKADKHTKHWHDQLCQLLNPPLRCGYRPGGPEPELYRLARLGSSEES